MRKALAVCVITLLIFSLLACSKKEPAQEISPVLEEAEMQITEAPQIQVDDLIEPLSSPSPAVTESEAPEDGNVSSQVQLTLQIGSSNFVATLYDNPSVQALTSLLPMTVEMIELNGNEKYYNLPDSLPADAGQVGTINAGDIMLYGDNCIVLFYETFDTAYSYTPLGYINDPTGLADAVGTGSVEIVFSLETTSIKSF